MLTEDEWINELTKGCQRIGRNLNDTRGLFHSFHDSREQMVQLFADLQDMLGNSYLDWEIAFEFRLKRSRYYEVRPLVQKVGSKRSVKCRTQDLSGFYWSQSAHIL